MERYPLPADMQVGAARRDLRRRHRQAARPARGARPRGVLGRRRGGRRPPGDHHLVLGGRPGRDQRRRRHQGDDARAALRRARGRAPRRWSPSGTCPTTSRCSSGPARRTPWPTRTRASSSWPAASPGQRGRRGRGDARGALRPLSRRPAGRGLAASTDPNISTPRGLVTPSITAPIGAAVRAAERADERRDDGADPELHAAQHRGRRTGRLAVPGQRQRRGVGQREPGRRDQQRQRHQHRGQPADAGQPDHQQRGRGRHRARRSRR